ncbi:MAG: hypothetical protein H8D23_26045 [Candidatus Brocadiales bacterium]|nr:hypothetical protein [Candidatus Brocadiales bacterium]
MKVLILIMLVATIFASATESIAQRGMGRGRGPRGWGPGNEYCLMYKPDTVVTISGEVISVEKTVPRKGMFYGIHLIVKTGEETISVHLGPGWYVEDQGITFKPEDKLEITGSKVTFDEEQVIIASEVKKGDETLKLRDKNGIPYWSGWRKRSDMRPINRRGMCWIATCGCGPCTQYCSIYSPNKMETVFGNVVSIEKATSRRRMSYGVHLIVKSDEETLSVRLGPEWFMEGKNFTIMPDDKVEIKGHRISDRGEEAIIAAEIKKGDKVLKLREENGLPFWSR